MFCKCARIHILPSVVSHKCKGPRNTYLKQIEKYLHHKDYIILIVQIKTNPALRVNKVKFAGFKVTAIITTETGGALDKLKKTNRGKFKKGKNRGSV